MSSSLHLVHVVDVSDDGQVIIGESPSSFISPMSPYCPHTCPHVLGHVWTESGSSLVTDGGDCVILAEAKPSDPSTLNSRDTSIHIYRDCRCVFCTDWAPLFPCLRRLCGLYQCPPVPGVTVIAPSLTWSRH